jgi:transketolase
VAQQSAAARPDAIRALEALCRELRVEILQMVHAAGSGHPGGSLSAIDLVAALYGHVLRHDPAKPEWPDRDRFVLSKGHGVPALYAVLAHHGYFPRQALATLRQLGSPLQGHPVAHTAPGVEACTGSLGQGLSIALGMALAARLDGSERMAFCMLGDGEIQEGQVWEAAMAAGRYAADGLVAILDFNKGQLDGTLAEIMPLDPVDTKWESFGWLVRRIDGHDHGAILDAYDWARQREQQPKLIVADTVKGKGVSFMENDLVWHYRSPSDEQLAAALAELGEQA